MMILAFLAGFAFAQDDCDDPEGRIRAAERDLLGSDDNLRVNDVAYTEDTHGLFYCASVDGASSSTWSASMLGWSSVLGQGNASDGNDVVVSDGDSVVRSFDATGRETVRVPIAESVTTSSGWRLRLAAAGQTEPGRRYGVVVFDPLAVSARSHEIEILEAASLAFPDSADTDSISGAWISVREDTVQAWRVRSGQGDLARETWIDEDGRLVDGEIFGGLRVERTAFELAFFTRPGSAVPDSVQTQPEERE